MSPYPREDDSYAEDFTATAHTHTRKVATRWIGAVLFLFVLRWIKGLV